MLQKKLPPFVSLLQDKLGINDYKESAWMPGAPGIRCSYIYFYQNAVQLKQEANESHEDKFIIHFVQPLFI